MNVTKIISFFLLTTAIIAHAQSTVKIYGYVSDQQTAKPLYGANVYIVGTHIGAITDHRGYFELENVLAGTYQVIAQYIGYSEMIKRGVVVSLDHPMQLYFQLKPEIIALNELQVTAGRPEMLLNGNLITISRKAIAESNLQTAGELLRQIPGVDVQSSGSAGSAVKISIRGSHSNQVLVILDGVPLNDALGGEADLSQIPANIIEQLVVQKGGGSAEHGSGAIGGVIKISTRTHFENKISLDSSVGRFGLYSLEPSLSGHFKNMGYFISYNYVESDGDYPYSYRDSEGQIQRENRLNADFLSRNLFSRINYSTGSHLISLNGQMQKSGRGVPGKIDGWTPYSRINTNMALGGISWHFDTAIINAALNARYSEFETANSNLYPADVELRYRRYPAYDYTYTTKNTILQGKIDYQPLNWTQISIGSNTRKLNYRDESFRPGFRAPVLAAEDLSCGVFWSQKFSVAFSLLKSQFELTPALRYDEMEMTSGDIQRTEQQWSPKLNLFSSMGQQYKLVLKGNISRSFRAPTFADLFYQDVRVEGKPDLLPEKSLNREVAVGTIISILGNLRLEYTLFRNSIDDLIVWRLGSYEVFRPYNTNAEIDGQEVMFDYSAPQNIIELNAGYSYISALNKSENVTSHDKIIPYRSERSFKAVLNLNLKNWQFKTHYRYVGRRYINDANTKWLNSYQVVDCVLNWKKRFGVAEFNGKISILNVSDERYQIVRDMPLPGREWRVGMQISR